MKRNAGWLGVSFTTECDNVDVVADANEYKVEECRKDRDHEGHRLP